MHIADIETPALLVDLDIMERNLARAATYAALHGLALRPHVKTHKSPLVAARQVALGATGLTCATPFEAQIMASVTDDILVAYPPVGAARARRLATLPSNVQLIVALDSEMAVVALSQAAATASRTIGVYVELDVGMHRVGVPGVREGIALAQRISADPNLEFTGIAFYPGHVRETVNDQDAKLAALGDALVSALQAFEREGLSPRVVSGGSTPTLWRTHEIAGVTRLASTRRSRRAVKALHVRTPEVLTPGRRQVPRASHPDRSPARGRARDRTRFR